MRALAVFDGIFFRSDLYSNDDLVVIGIEFWVGGDGLWRVDVSEPR